jgi:signal transduction histidine kinase
MAKQATTENDKFKENDSNQARLEDFSVEESSVLVSRKTRYLRIFTKSDKGMTSRIYPRSSHNDLSHKMAQILLNHSDDVTLVPSIAEAIRNLFQVDGCLIGLVKNSEKSMASTIDWSLSTSSEIKEKFGDQVNVPPQAIDLQPLWDAIVADEHKLLISQPSAVFSQLNSTSWLSELGGSLIAIATPPTEPVVGGLVLMTMQPLSWTETKMQQLKQVSNQVAIAISNVQQQRQIHSYKQQVDSIRQQQNLIHQMTMAIHHWNDLDQILQMAIDKLVDSLQVKQGLILLLKYQDPLYKSRAFGQFSQHQEIKRMPRAKVTVVGQSNLPDSEAIYDPDFTPSENVRSFVKESFWLSDCAWCRKAFMQAPASTNILDAQHDDESNLETTSKIAEIFQTDHRMTSGINVPIMAMSSSGGGNTILGFLVLQDSSDRHWTCEELKMMELVGIQLGNAILQNQTLHQVQALVEDRNAQLKRSMEVQAKLYELTRQQLEQLRKLNEVKDEFLDTLNHELKTPLATMRMAIENLRRPGISEQRQAMYLDMMQAQLNRETKLVNDLLKLRELEFRNSNIQLELLDLKPFLNHLAENFEQTWSEKELTLSLKWPRKSVKLQTDPKNLEHAMVELLTNAGKYSDPATTVQVEVMQPSDSTDVVIKISNIGAGISEKDLPHIFEKFRRGQGMTQKAVAGTGLGLALVKSLIEHLNGTITVTSQPLQKTENSQDDLVPWETCFTVTLPQQAKAPTL